MAVTALAYAAFFVSGAAALLYQVIWQRMLVLFAGADIYAVTIIVAAFMTGLGFGNLVGGHAADRLGARGSLWAFVGAELAIGGFGLVSKGLYYDLLYTRLSFLSGSSAGVLVLFLLLLVPTFFMGASLPLLARGLTPDVAWTGRVVGSLYGWNAIGAAAGALITTWLLLPRLGLTDSLQVGAALNGLCAVAGAAVAIGARTAVRDPGAGAEASGHASDARGSASAAASSLSFGAWAAVYAITGFVALALEIVWFRLLGVMLKASAFTFGTLLTAYLAGLGLGAILGARLVMRSGRPGLTFLVLQAVLVVLTGASFALIVSLVSSGRLEVLAEHFASHEYDVERGVGALRDVLRGEAEPGQSASLRMFGFLYVALPAVLITVPTFLMGLAFPFLQKAVHADFGRIGRRVGGLMTANIAGSALGAIATGLVLLPQLGAALTFKLLVALAAVPVLLLAREAPRDAPARRRPRVALALGALAALTVLSLPDSARLWAALHGSTSEQVLVAEDGAGVSVLRSDTPSFSGQTWVFVNGLSQSWVPFGQMHTVLGALPSLVHPRPEEIAVIGLGSGDTAYSAAARPDVREVVCIEIIGAQRPTLERLGRLIDEPGLDGMLADPRIVHVVGDGRAHLLQTGRRFDIIEADALRPSSAFSGNLYSFEYFELLRRHLKVGGLAVTWAPTERVRRTFVKVFPYVLAFDDIYLGSNEPIAFDLAAVQARMRSPHVWEHFRRAGINIERQLDEWLGESIERFGPDYDRAALTDLNFDLFPKDEFSLPRVLPF